MTDDLQAAAAAAADLIADDTEDRGEWGRYLLELVAVVRAARAVAQEYYQDIRQLEGDYQWEKHYAHDPEQPDRTWLVPVQKLGP